MTAVRAEYRPTLREELAGMPPALRRTVVVVLALIVLALAVVILRPEDDGVDVVVAEPIAFNLRYPETFDRRPPQGDEVLRLERRRGGEFADSLTIEPIELPAYRGDVAGLLPVYADREIARLRERYPEFELVQEGKARINDIGGYTITFRASREPRLYGRIVLLPVPTGGQPEPGKPEPIMVDGPSPAIRMTLLATPLSGLSNANEVGVRGGVKVPYRTFRFGTEKP